MRNFFILILLCMFSSLHAQTFVKADNDTTVMSEYNDGRIWAFILLDISDESQEPFDELLIEQSAKSIWVHFAVRPEGNRRKVAFLKK